MFKKQQKEKPKNKLEKQKETQKRFFIIIITMFINVNKFLIPMVKLGKL